MCATSTLGREVAAVDFISGFAPSRPRPREKPMLAHVRSSFHGSAIGSPCVGMIGRLTTSKRTLVAGVQRDAGEHERARLHVASRPQDRDGLPWPSLTASVRSWAIAVPPIPNAGERPHGLPLGYQHH